MHYLLSVKSVKREGKKKHFHEVQYNCRINTIKICMMKVCEKRHPYREVNIIQILGVFFGLFLSTAVTVWSNILIHTSMLCYFVFSWHPLLAFGIHFVNFWYGYSWGFLYRHWSWFECSVFSPMAGLQFSSISSMCVGLLLTQAKPVSGESLVWC